MRAGKTEVIGTPGQSAVKAQFEKLRWGANPNDDHDLGTDLWLQPRDERRFDLNSVAGAQVKTSETKGPNTYFKSPKKDADGNVLGWWYYESPEEDHFDYWTRHTAPHLLILHDLETAESYWVHVTSERLVAAGAGKKIFVPVHQLVDEAHNRELIEVATSGRPHIPWEGSAWAGAKTLAAGDLLRHALLVPRLVAPHRNDRPKAFQPEQAVAALVLQRQSDLEDRVPDAEGRSKSKLWSWAFVTALEAYLMSGDPEAFKDALDSAKKASDKVAVVCTWAAAHLERAEASDALALLDTALADDDASPEDHVWLLVQRARCLNELGRRDEAKKVALDALAERNSAPDDPTLTALCGAASWIVFSSSPFGARSIADFVTGSDNVASWWRTQTTAWGAVGKLRGELPHLVQRLNAQGWVRRFSLE
jgi:tetratricopeptide (TPR) repeat protein